MPTLPSDNPKMPPEKRHRNTLEKKLSGVVPKIVAPRKNCRQKNHLTFDCPISTCYDCRDAEVAYNHLQSECNTRIWKENRVAMLARQAARDVMDLAAFDDSDENYTDDDA